MYFIRNSFGRHEKKRRKEEREKKKADKLLKYSTANNPVRENSSDVGIEICTRMIQHPGSNSCLLRNEILIIPG